MYIAELRGKLSRDQENMEDLLTSNVFSFLKYAPRDIFLYKYINHLGVAVTQTDARNARFQFWPTYNDLTEPDVVILIGGHYLLFEAKLLSGFGQETDTVDAQLLRELRGGMTEAHNLGFQFQLFAITADYFRPLDLYSGIPEIYHESLRWTSWQQFSFFLYSLLLSETGLADETFMLAQDLYDLLDKKGLRRFEGSRALAIDKYSLSSHEKLFFSGESAKYRGDFIGFSSALPQDMLFAFVPDSIFLRRDNPYFSTLLAENRKMNLTSSPLYFQGEKDE